MRIRNCAAWIIGSGALTLAATGAWAQPAPQTEADAYTRYELLSPGSASFKITYEITATTPEATVYDNPLRRGSAASDETTIDLATGKPLVHETVSAEAARADGVTGDSADQYLRVHLARPVPRGGGGRILIIKTYADPKSYRVEPDGTIDFSRSLGIRRNTVVLPAGYELVSCNQPSQVLQEPDGRLRISFWQDAPGPTPLELRARQVKGRLTAPGSATAGVPDRAHQTRDIVYDLQPPETHAFSLYHDYTETKAGIDHYVNVVRTGSTVQNPSGLDLDTGAPLRTEVLKGAAITAEGISEPDLKVTPDTEVVVFRYPAIPTGGSKRLRMSETYTDAERYRIEGGELVWRRALGRAHDVVRLPAGWALSASSIPAVVTTEPGGRVRVEFTNPRPDEVETVITAHRAG